MKQKNIFEKIHDDMTDIKNLLQIMLNMKHQSNRAQEEEYRMSALHLSESRSRVSYADLQPSPGATSLQDGKQKDDHA